MGGIRSLRGTVSRDGDPGLSVGSLLHVLVYAAFGLTPLAAGCGESTAGQQEAVRDPKLERRVEELLPEIERISHLEALHVPTVRVASASVLESYLLERIETEYPGDELEKMARAYQEFGLLPEDVDLERMLVELLLEQALGYYDPARDVLFIRAEVPRAGVEQVLVHELVHALQDQHIDLDSLIRARSQNDARMAAQSAMEGHATLAMFVYQLGEMTGSPVAVEHLPEISPEMADQASDSEQMRKLNAAPRIVRETLIFPYFGGARYLQRLWRIRGEQFAPLDEYLPESTEQILHVDRMLPQRDRPSLIKIDPPENGWNIMYASDLGELEITLYFEEHLGSRRAAQRAASGWDGDSYALLEKDGQHALVWYSAWDSESEAEEFARAYRETFKLRFGGDGEDLETAERIARVVSMELSGVPTVLIVEMAPGVELGRAPGASLQTPVE